MMEKWRNSAKNLIYHYRISSEAMKPFATPWTKDMIKDTGVDETALTYIREMLNIVAGHGEPSLLHGTFTLSAFHVAYRTTKGLNRSRRLR